jgi:UDP-glucose:(heptosyl)LPS alpha-1,3-glucosyltransferase
MLECANFLAGRGHQTHVYATDWEADSLHPDVIRHSVPVPMRPALRRLLGFARRSQCELSGLTPPAQVLGGFGVVSPPGGVIWVQSVHRAWLEISRQQRTLWGRIKQRCNPMHPVVLALEQDYFARRKYRKLIALSQEVRADLMRFYHVPEEEIVILPNGYAPEEFHPAQAGALRNAMRARLGYDAARKVVIFVANELERKGFGPLLRAIAALDDPQVCLLAVGRLDAQAYSGEIQRLGMADRVRFTGPTNRVADFYAAADVFALPTQYEAWGLVIVEAMACGLPVLTSRLAGAAIAVKEGETGILLDDPNDSNEIAAKLSQLLPKRGYASPEEIAESVAPYAWSHILARYEEILLQHCH